MGLRSLFLEKHGYLELLLITSSYFQLWICFNYVPTSVIDAFLPFSAANRKTATSVQTQSTFNASIMKVLTEL